MTNGTSTSFGRGLRSLLSSLALLGSVDLTVTLFGYAVHVTFSANGTLRLLLEISRQTAFVPAPPAGNSP